jgi:hypothetical protein
LPTPWGWARPSIISTASEWRTSPAARIELLHYGTAALETVPGLRIIGTAREKVGVLSFVLEGVRTEEIGDYLNREGIAVRAGHHCAQPIHRRFGIESTVRASLALYNTCGYSCRTIGIRQPVPKARDVTFKTGAACFLLNSAMRTRRSTRRTVCSS